MGDGRDAILIAARQFLMFTAKSILTALLMAVVFGYAVAIALAWLDLTSSGSTWPDLQKLDQRLFGFHVHSSSQIERLLIAKDGPMNGSGTMRPAFTRESVNWDIIHGCMSPEEQCKLLAERDGERLALLDWVQSGADRDAYDKDDYPLSPGAATGPITSRYLVVESSSGPGSACRVRIRTLIADRCATCHSEGGRNDKACWFPLENYKELEPYCRAERQDQERNWPLIAFVALLPMTLVGSPVFYFTAPVSRARTMLAILPLAAIFVAILCWIVGRPGGLILYLFSIAAGAAAVMVTAQLIASLAQLLARRPT